MHHHNIQGISDILKKWNLILNGVEEGAGIKNLRHRKIFTKIIAENLPDVEKDMAMKYKRLWGPPVCVTIKMPLKNTSSLTWKVKKIKNKINQTHTKKCPITIWKRKKKLTYNIKFIKVISYLASVTVKAKHEMISFMPWNERTANHYYDIQQRYLLKFIEK